MAGEKATNVEFRSRLKMTEYLDSSTVTQVLAVTTATVVLTHPVVKLDSSAGAVTTLTLPDGKAGQMLVVISDDANDMDLTPTTSYGWSVMALDTVGDIATLFYVDDTTGWIILGTAGVDGTSPLFTV